MVGEGCAAGYADLPGPSSFALGDQAGPAPPDGQGQRNQASDHSLSAETRSAAAAAAAILLGMPAV